MTPQNKCKWLGIVECKVEQGVLLFYLCDVVMLLGVFFCLFVCVHDFS